MQLLLSLLLSLNLAAATGEVILKIPPGISLKEEEIRADLPRTVPIKGGYDRIEIVIYYFSQGIEKFSYSDNNTMQESLMKGEIKALVKLKTKNVLRKALFISASGSSREQMTRNLSLALADTLAGL